LAATLQFALVAGIVHYKAEPLYTALGLDTLSDTRPKMPFTLAMSALLLMVGAGVVFVSAVSWGPDGRRRVDWVSLALGSLMAICASVVIGIWLAQKLGVG